VSENSPGGCFPDDGPALEFAEHVLDFGTLVTERLAMGYLDWPI
jgi:hypothetical protein